jgi:hypothetical protein
MGLFKKQPTPAADSTVITQLKGWVYEALALSQDIPISISQLQCTEPGCPPLETVIAVMTHPPQTYQIHKPAAAIQLDDVRHHLQP